MSFQKQLTQYETPTPLPKTKKRLTKRPTILHPTRLPNTNQNYSSNTRKLPQRPSKTKVTTKNTKQCHPTLQYTKRNLYLYTKANNTTRLSKATTNKPNKNRSSTSTTKETSKIPTNKTSTTGNSHFFPTTKYNTNDRTPLRPRRNDKTRRNEPNKSRPPSNKRHPHPNM